MCDATRDKSQDVQKGRLLVAFFNILLADQIGVQPIQRFN